jgi:predicted PurR-regulated permease PerM
MKTIIAGIFSTVFICVAFAGVFFLIGYWIVRAGKRAAQRENEYEKLYSEITKMIDNNLAAINEANYDFIMDKLIKLGRLKHKDREKTTVLNIKFIRKYSTFFERQKVKV